MRPFLLVLLVSVSGLLMGCRSYTPVERHFLRVPALSAAALAGPDRAKWLKRSRRQAGFRETALEKNWMVLTADARPSGVSAAPGEVSFFPDGPGSRSGVVALNWEVPEGPAGHTRLYLLKTNGGRYVPIPWQTLLPEAREIHRFSLGDPPGALTAYREIPPPAGSRWRKVAALSWKPQGWRPIPSANLP